MKTFILVILISLALLNPLPSHAINILNFGLSQISTYQSKSKGTSFSGIASWNPEIFLISDLSLLGNIGVSPMKGTTRNFLMFEASVLLGFPLTDSLRPEIGGGMQMWNTNSGSANKIAQAQIGYFFKGKWFGLIDRLLIGYTGVFMSGNFTHEGRFGVRIDL